MLNMGANHRIGPRRINVKLARRDGGSAASAASASTSPAWATAAPASAGRTSGRRRVLDMQARDEPDRHHARRAPLHRDRAVLRGAATGMSLAVADARVVGLLMFDGHVLPGPARRAGSAALRRALAVAVQPSTPWCAAASRPGSPRARCCSPKRDGARGALDIFDGRSRRRHRRRRLLPFDEPSWPDATSRMMLSSTPARMSTSDGPPTRRPARDLRQRALRAQADYPVHAGRPQLPPGFATHLPCGGAARLLMPCAWAKGVSAAPPSTPAPAERRRRAAVGAALAQPQLSSTRAMPAGRERAEAPARGPGESLRAAALAGAAKAPAPAARPAAARCR